MTSTSKTYGKSAAPGKNAKSDYKNSKSILSYLTKSTKITGSNGMNDETEVTLVKTKSTSAKIEEKSTTFPTTAAKKSVVKQAPASKMTKPTNGNTFNYSNTVPQKKKAKKTVKESRNEKKSSTKTRMYIVTGGDDVDVDLKKLGRALKENLFSRQADMDSDVDTPIDLVDSCLEKKINVTATTAMVTITCLGNDKQGYPLNKEVIRQGIRNYLKAKKKVKSISIKGSSKTNSIHLTSRND